MSNKSKKEYLKRITSRYLKSNRNDKKKILDEFCKVCGYNRKYAIRLISNQTKSSKPKKKKGYPVTYGSDVVNALRTIWKASGYICSKRLKEAIPLYLPFYELKHHLPEIMKQKLLKISHQTIDRKIAPHRRKLKGKGISTTKPGKLLKNQIPIKGSNFDVSKPGHLEADTVAHCGDSLAGDFAYTVSCVDILTTWTEQRAIFNKGQIATQKAIEDIENSLPFPLKGFDCDNGSEFINYHLFNYCTNRPAKEFVEFSRSRPYKKDDNAHVEQKNWTNVRRLLGYSRFDNPDVVNLMNDLYAKEWNYFNNFFCPSMKLVSKKRVGSKYVRIHDKPKTPFQRVLECKDISQDKKEELSSFFKTLNPFELNDIINRKVNNILKNSRLPKL